VKLTYIQTENLKRLKGGQKMPVREKVICIVGQNSAGKSTLLQTFGRCMNGPVLAEHDGTREGLEYLPPSMKLFFELEKADKDFLSGIFGAEDLKGAWVSIDRDEFRKVVVEPQIPRDLSLRDPAAKAIEKVENAVGLILDEINADGSLTDLRAQSEELLPNVRSYLASNDDYLDGDEIGAINQLISYSTQIVSAYRSWVDANDPERAEKSKKHDPAIDLNAAIQALGKASAKESEDSPAKRAAEIMEGRLPKVLWFSPENRNLEASYPLTDERPQDDSAIHNILKLAETSWEEVVRISRRDVSFHTQLVDETREALKRNFSAKLTSHSIPGVTLWVTEGFLHVQTELSKGMPVPIDFQSEGTRQMVALLAFIANRSANTNPIILIDEAEQHLHYDAQSDLVKVFERQPDASKVIYTTHSAGCLPSDIAIGVRGVIPDGVYSAVEDNIWKRGSGYSPLMIAMGASAFGFGTARKTVFTEGLTDAQLLPRLIREAIGEDLLEYQMVPHFASADVEALKELDFEAPRVAFISDHDGGGKDHYRRILEAGYEKDQIIDLGDGLPDKLYLEDLVRPEILEEALNALTGTEGNFPAEKIPESGRWDFIEKARGKLKEGDVLFDKKKLASHILDISDRNRFKDPARDVGEVPGLLDGRHRDALVKTDAALKKILDRKKAGKSSNRKAGTKAKTTTS